MPDPDDGLERASQEFSEQVSDRVMAAIIAAGLSVRHVAAEAGIDRTTLQDRLNNVRPFNTDELSRLGTTLGVEPWRFIPRS